MHNVMLLNTAAMARKDRGGGHQWQSGSCSLQFRGCRTFCFNCYQADATGGHSPSGLSDHLPRTSMYEACWKLKKFQQPLKCRRNRRVAIGVPPPLSFLPSSLQYNCFTPCQKPIMFCKKNSILIESMCIICYNIPGIWQNRFFCEFLGSIL